MKYNILIKISNKAEKVAAAYFLADYYKQKIAPNMVKETLNGEFSEYIYVGVFGGIISAYRIPPTNMPDVIIVPFNDLHKIESYTEFTEVKLNDTITAKVYKSKIVVGCQTFPIDVIVKLNKAHIEQGKWNEEPFNVL